jgi:hypothetical protein
MPNSVDLQCLLDSLSFFSDQVANSVDPDQMVLMCWLIWIYIGSTHVKCVYMVLFDHLGLRATSTFVKLSPSYHGMITPDEFFFTIKPI